MIKLGHVSGPHAVKGEVKIYSYAESPERFTELEVLYVGSEDEFATYEIESARINGPTPILKLAGVDDRNAAEELRDVEVYMSEDDLPALPAGEYYIKDLIGFVVITEEGEKIGTLKDIQTNRPQKLYVVSTDARDVYIPGVDEFILEKNVDEKKIVVRLPEGLLEI